MTPSEMTETHAIAADIFGKLFGAAGKMIVAAAILTSASGALNSNVLTGARIPFAVGSDFSKLGWLGKVHHRLETPVSCLLLNAAWAGVLVLWGNFEQLLFFCGFIKWLFFTLAGVSVFILRKKIKERTSFAMKGYPWVPILFTLTSLILCLISVRHAPREAFFGLLILLSGIPAYRFLRPAQK
jgi:APA family basic amino acid/polyamine antiporter